MEKLKNIENKKIRKIIIIADLLLLLVFVLLFYFNYFKLECWEIRLGLFGMQWWCFLIDVIDLIVWNFTQLLYSIIIINFIIKIVFILKTKFLNKDITKGKQISQLIMRTFFFLWIVFIIKGTILFIFYAAKPVIYLYPETTTEVSVNLDYKWEVFARYPEYNQENGWKVVAEPNGTIYQDGKEYSYLFWEWNPDYKPNYDWSKWFVVKWSEARKFLQEKLAEIWLTPREYNEFIVYWYPKLQENEYNLVHFATEEEYWKYAELNIFPKPESVLRVFMVYKKTSKNTEVEAQVFEKFERKWFSVVEWGGSGK